MRSAGRAACQRERSGAGRAAGRAARHRRAVAARHFPTGACGASSRVVWHTRRVAVSLNRILEARGATRVRIAPDGTWLGYASDLTGTVQLWRVPIDGGMPVRLTFDTDRVGAYRISPDGTRIAYGADAGGNERWQIWVMNADGNAARSLTDQRDRIHHLRA